MGMGLPLIMTISTPVMLLSAWPSGPSELPWLSTTEGLDNGQAHPEEAAGEVVTFEAMPPEELGISSWRSSGPANWAGDTPYFREQITTKLWLTTATLYQKRKRGSPLTTTPLPGTPARFLTLRPMG